MDSPEVVMVEKLKERYASWELEIEPPPKGPRSGSARQAGGSGSLRYMFSENERGPYLEYYLFHRIWGDGHGRFYATGEFERLDTLATTHIVTGDPVKDRETVEKLEARNRRLIEELEAAGLLSGGPVPNSFTINSAIATGAVRPDEDESPGVD